MSQVFSQIPRQLLQQTQRLTPQLIQAMDILQLNSLALESRIEQEIDNNPALELASPEADFGPSEDEAPSPDPRAEAEKALELHDGDAQDFERLDTLASEYREDNLFEEERISDYAPSRAAAGDELDGKFDAMSNAPARSISLQDYLLQQWALTETPEPQRTIGAKIIEYLDENGRLNATLDEIGGELRVPATPAELEAALAAVQQLEPAGVGARSVQECLLLQLRRLPGDNSLEMRIIADHFDELQKNKLPAIARDLKIDVEELKAALDVIKGLSLHPGAEVSQVAAPSIVPDLIVDYDEAADRYTVRTARTGGRELRISEEFREQLEKARGDRKAREFLKQKLDAAAQIIDAVRFRRERLLEVGKAVVEAQRDFLEHGEQHLRVLHMSDLAERFGCDPSTISRTVDEKYIQTPVGIFPLRKFFTSGMASDEGDQIGWESIRAKVAEIVARENKSNPLRDDEIVDRLRSEGIDLKRRTVAKYRAQLNIPTSRQRKEY